LLKGVRAGACGRRVRPYQRVAGQQHAGELALPAELVDDVGGLAPVGVDEAAVDPHLGAVLAAIRPAQPLAGELLERPVDLPLQVGVAERAGDGGGEVAEREV